MRIILIVSDTFRYDHLGINGNDWIRTRELDGFGRDAVIFDNYYTSSFPTIPNRCDMTTGRFGFPFHGWQPLEPDEIAIPERLSQAGMHTQLICDTPHLLKRNSNFWRGFQSYYWNRGQEGDTHFLRLNDPPASSVPSSKTRPVKMHGFEVGLVDIHRWINQEWVWEGDTFAATTSQIACKWIEKNYKCDNFFLWVDFFDAHEPWDAPEHFVQLYDPGYRCQRMMHPNYGRASAYTPAELRNLRANYAAEVTLVSKWIGHLLRKLKDCSIYDDCFIIFTTDHGMYLGEHNRTGKSSIHPDDRRKPWPLYREITHIPLMIKPPRCKGGARRREIAQPPDICPTILDAAGLPRPDGMVGRSLMPLLEGRKDAQWDRKCAVSGRELTDSLETFPGLTITDTRWQLHVGGNRAPELYDLRKDPAQKRNVASAHPRKLRELHRALIALLEEAGASEDRVEIARQLLL